MPCLAPPSSRSSSESAAGRGRQSRPRAPGTAPHVSGAPSACARRREGRSGWVHACSRAQHWFGGHEVRPHTRPESPPPSHHMRPPSPGARARARWLHAHRPLPPFLARSLPAPLPEPPTPDTWGSRSRRLGTCASPRSGRRPGRAGADGCMGQGRGRRGGSRVGSLVRRAGDGQSAVVGAAASAGLARPLSPLVSARPPHACAQQRLTLAPSPSGPQPSTTANAASRPRPQGRPAAASSASRRVSAAGCVATQ